MLPILPFHSSQTIPLKTFIKSRILGYIRAAKTVPCKLLLSTSLHDQNEKWPGAICVIYCKITLSCYVLPLLFIPSWWCCVTDIDADWYCHFYEATVIKMLYQDLLGWRKNSNCPPDTWSISYSITCCFWGVPYAWCSCSQCSLHLWTYLSVFHPHNTCILF